MNELLNQISNFDIQNLTNTISIFQFRNSHYSLRELITPAFISAIISGIVTLIVNSIDNRSQQRMALYQKKCEFWLDFCKEYFSIEPFLSYMIKQSRIPWGISTMQSEDEIKAIYKDWLQRWKSFYNKVKGNERIYLEPEKIDVLMLNSFFTSLEENLESINITRNEGNIETCTISSESITKIIRRAKELFELNVEINSELGTKYVNVLNKYSSKEKKQDKEKDKALTYEQMMAIVNEMSDKAFIEFLKKNLKDTTEKLEKIVSTKSLLQKVAFLLENIKQKLFPNSLIRWIRRK